MSTIDALANASRSTPAWQLALDKIPFHSRNGLPVLSEPDDREKPQSIKSKRLRQIRDASKAASAIWAEAISSRLAFFDALKRQHGPRFRRFALLNSSRLLLHLGRASVLENVGLFCDHTTGLPIIPATAIKGVASTWACWEANEDENLAEKRNEFLIDRSTFRNTTQAIFGDNSTGGSSHAGSVVFLDAFPANAPCIGLDILTPHPDEGRGLITPTPFLCIEAGAVWHFGLVAREAGLLDDSVCLVRAALMEMGVGAKTSSGYGAFRELDGPEQAKEDARAKEVEDCRRREAAELAEAERIKTLSPEEQAYESFLKETKDWTAAARDVLSANEPKRGFIIRFFRSPQGQSVLASWPRNEKATKRLAALKEAGL
jgi:CRISPR type III-B/RAMP module RAMP protein Cmr6